MIEDEDEEEDEITLNSGDTGHAIRRLNRRG
jgi:hypothetical protein